MNMDVFVEHMVKHKKEGKDFACIVGLIAAGVVVTLLVFFAMGLLVFRGINIAGILLLVIAVAWYGVFLLVRMRNLEYEYILTNSDLDVDKVIAKNGRKHVEDIDLKEILLCANIKDTNFAHEYNNTETITKVIDATGDQANGNVYFIDYHVEGGRRRLLFQPSKKMRDAMRTANPRNIHIMEE